MNSRDGSTPASDEAGIEERIQAAGLTAPRITPQQIGRDIAKRNARDKIWSLEGYVLRNQLMAVQR